MIEFHLDAVPPSLNRWSRAHWSVRKREAASWRTRVWAEWLQLGKPRVPVAAWVAFDFDLPRGGDADNRVKLVLDGLVGTFLADDGPECVQELRVRARRASPARCTVRIEPAASAPPAATRTAAAPRSAAAAPRRRSRGAS